MSDAPQVEIQYASDSVYGGGRFDHLMINALNQNPGWNYTVYNRLSTNTDIETVTPDSWELLAGTYDTSNDDVRMVYQTQDGLVSLIQDIRHGSTQVITMTKDKATGIRLGQVILDKLEPIKVDPQSMEVPVQFWYQGQHGPQSITRDITGSVWEEVANNYSHPVRDKLADLINIRPPFDGGKLILLSGPPGTGKTHLIRSLTRTWAPWCDANYVGDTERFFGSTGDLISLVLSNSSRHIDIEEYLESLEAGIEPPTALTGKDRYRLFIMEDTDEFLTADAKTRTGQAMSRLLNLADGMIGQGVRALFLITTNENVATLHPAISRPGRALANIEFKALSMDEAREWMKAQGGDATDIHGEVTLAELYDKLREQQHIVDRPAPTRQTGLYL